MHQMNSYEYINDSVKNRLRNVNFKSWPLKDGGVWYSAAEGQSSQRGGHEYQSVIYYARCDLKCYVKGVGLVQEG